MEMQKESKSCILRARGIGKTFNDPSPLTVLRGVDLDLLPGESIAIRGRSGEGKSTLLHILGTLENPTEGTITISGQDVSTLNRSTLRNKHLGFIFQSFHLFHDLTVLENVLMPAKVARKSCGKNSDAYLRACQLIETVGLHDRSKHLTKQLSGGEKQRVAIARALCNDPDILFADEPSGNLDAKTADVIHQLLMDFSHNHGKAIVVVTHNQDLAALCDTRYVLHEGKMITQ